MKNYYNTGKMVVRNLLKEFASKALMKIADNYKFENTEVKKM